MFDKSMRILVVDDMTTMRKIVMKNLMDLGFTNLMEAADGVKGWEIFSTANPPVGLVLSDWNMPNCTGIDLLKRVRADQKFNKTPFILITAEAEQHQVAEAVKAGVDNYLVKPFTKEQIVSKLEAVYKKYSA